MNEDKKIEEQIKKQDEPKEEQPVETVEETVEQPVEEKAEPVEEKTEEVAKEDAEEAPVEEEVVKKTEEPVEEKKSVEEPVEKKEDVKSTEITVKLDVSEFKEEFAKMADSIKDLTDKFSQVEEKLSKSAPTEGASVEKTKETPEEVAKVEAPKEEDAGVEKQESSPEGANEAVLKAIESLKSEVFNRLKKLEDQPAPSKVVFNKDFVGAKDTDEPTVEKINDRLNELTKLMTTDPSRYMRENMADEAIALVKQKKALLASTK